jgi:xanthine dehydrogenase accessory factor
MAERVWVEDIARALSGFDADGNTYGLIMTRGHSNDEEALFHLVGKPFRYLGLIGSRRKIRMIFEDLEKEGVPREQLDRVYAPLGFDIGSQTVPEIALSIVSFLVGHRNRGPEAFPPPRWVDAEARAGG